MKKSFYLAALAIAALSSCSSDEIVAEKGNITQSEDRVPIVLGLGTPTMTVTTRGTGTIGGTTAETNHWHGERIRVLMTQIPDAVYPEFCFTYRTDNEINTELFNNSFYCLPQELDPTSTEANARALLELQGVDTRYYPATGSSNFFGYYVDDALVDSTNQETLETTVFGRGDKAPKVKDGVTEEGMAYKYVDFLLDGSQDVMAGMAAHQTGYVGFSAKSARHNVHPQITMEHLLTRLTFSVVAGNKNANGVTVKDISVQSTGAGQLMVAYDANEPQPADDLITWDEQAENVDFHLKERATEAGELIYLGANGEKDTLQDLTPYTFELDPETYEYTAETAAHRMGDALFVRPGESDYMLKVITSYPQAGYDDYPVNLQVSLPSGETFARGKSYHITVVVYGLSEIKVYATLTAWDEGEEIPRLNEDPFEEEEEQPTPAPATTNFDEDGKADLTQFVVTDETGVTYDTESFTLTTTIDEERGIELTATEDDEVSGQELCITFVEAAQAKVVVIYDDDTWTELEMDAAAEVLYMAIDEKPIAKIQILLTEAGTLTLSEVIVNAESTQP